VIAAKHITGVKERQYFYEILISLSNEDGTKNIENVENEHEEKAKDVLERHS
jgi:hypothetical protein